MIDIGTVLGRYAQAWEHTDVYHQPACWAIHFDSDDVEMGHIGYPQVTSADRVAEITAGLMWPFAVVAEVASSYLVTNVANADDPRTIYVSGVIDTVHGVLSQHWDVPVSVDDLGSMITGVPHRGMIGPAKALSVISTLVNLRRFPSPRVSFDQAMVQSMERLGSMHG